MMVRKCVTRHEWKCGKSKYCKPTHEARKSTPTGLGNCRKLRECKSAANTVCKNQKFQTTSFKAEHYEQRERKTVLIDIEHDLQRDIEKVLPTVEASDIRLQLCKKPTLIHHKNLLAKIGKKIPFLLIIRRKKDLLKESRMVGSYNTWINWHLQKEVWRQYVWLFRTSIWCKGFANLVTIERWAEKIEFMIATYLQRKNFTVRKLVVKEKIRGTNDKRKQTVQVHLEIHASTISAIIK